jgi:hypothetical protein
MRGGGVVPLPLGRILRETLGGKFHPCLLSCANFRALGFGLTLLRRGALSRDAAPPTGSPHALGSHGRALDALEMSVRARLVKFSQSSR